MINKCSKKKERKALGVNQLKNAMGQKKKTKQNKKQKKKTPT